MVAGASPRLRLPAMADPKNGSFRVCLGFADGGASGCGCDACMRVDREEEVSCRCGVGVVDGEGAASARERRSRRRRGSAEAGGGTRGIWSRWMFWNEEDRDIGGCREKNGELFAR
jgi:hypothetical protein